MSEDRWGALGTLASVLILGFALGAAFDRCRHRQGKCEHVEERAHVEAVLDCLRRTEKGGP